MPLFLFQAFCGEHYKLADAVDVGTLNTTAGTGDLTAKDVIEDTLNISGGVAADAWDVAKGVYDGVDLAAQVLVEGAKTGKNLVITVKDGVKAAGSAVTGDCGGDLGSALADATAQFREDASTTVAESLVDDKIKVLQDEVVEDAREVFDDVMTVGKDVGGIAEDGADSAVKAGGSVINGDGDIDAVTEVGTDVATQIAQATIEAVGEVVCEELMDAIPGIGLCKGAYNLTWGSAYATAGATSVASGLVVGVLGGLAGAIASPWDDGELLRSSAKLAGSQACWGSSVLGEGTFGAIKGTANIVGQIPGTQIVTIPTSYIAGKGAKGCRTLR